MAFERHARGDGLAWQMSEAIARRRTTPYASRCKNAALTSHHAIVTMLTNHQRAVVRETWAQVLPIAPTAAKLFYGRLFEIAPSLRPLFRHAEMDVQGNKLMQVLGFAVAHLDKLDALAPTVEALGRRHATYGVEDRDYAAVGEALIWTLEQGLGPAFTEEARVAWTTTFQLIAGIMRSSVAGEIVAS